MKNIILTIALPCLMTIASQGTFAQEIKKLEAPTVVVEPQKDLKQAKIDSAADFEVFRRDSEMKLAENQTRITELKARKVIETDDARTKYDKKVLALEKRNNILKTRINECDKIETSDWSFFKREFNQDIAELGSSIKGLGAPHSK